MNLSLSLHVGAGDGALDAAGSDKGVLTLANLYVDKTIENRSWLELTIDQALKSAVFAGGCTRLC